VFNALIALGDNDDDPHPRQLMAAAGVFAWGTRLSSFLFQRILQDGHDKRFNRVRSKPMQFAIYWGIQAVWVLFTMLPVLILLGKKKKEQPEEITKRDYCGWGLWALGMYMEVVADREKSAFRANTANTGKFITGGLWDISRHPNYFGEMTLWAGMWLASTSSFKGIEHLSVAAPTFVA